MPATTPGEGQSLTGDSRPGSLKSHLSSVEKFLSEDGHTHTLAGKLACNHTVAPITRSL